MPPLSPGVAVALGAALAAAGAGVGAALALRRERRRAVLSLTAEHALAATLERRIAERTAELADAERVLRRMWTLGHQVALELDPERVVRRFIEAVVDVARADGGALALAHDEWTLRVAAGTGSGAALEGAEIPVDHSVMGRVLRTGEVWRVSDALADGAAAAHVASAGLVEGGSPRGVVCVPLVRRAEPGARRGALSIYSREPRHFSDAEVARVRAMTDMLSVALANAELVASLRREEWRYRTLFRAAPDVVLVALADGEVREANDCARDLVGLDPAGLVGRALTDFVAPADRPAVLAALERALAGGAAPADALRAEVRVTPAARAGAPGGERVAALAVRRVPEAEPPAALIIARDITAERDLRGRMVETERLAAVGGLVAGVAHEVNNPLGSISAYAQLLLREGGLTADQREMVEVVQGEAVRASQVVRDLLAFARRSEPAREPVDLTALVERTLRLRGYDLAAARVTTQLDLAPALPPVTGDARQLQQVVLNLVTNSLQAMAGDPRPRARTLGVRTRLAAGGVELELADSGPGVPAEARARIFEPFFTTKGEGEGTGLGLSVSYGIVAAHGGEIELAHTGPEGTTFRVRLPAAAPDAAAEASADDAPAARARRSPLAGMRLLFVDDEPALRTAAESFARRRGFTVLGAADGLEALSLLRSTGVDAVVCDVRMPRMGGAELHAVLHREQPGLARRTIFIAGDPSSAPAHHPVVPKPFRFEDIERAVMSVMR